MTGNARYTNPLSVYLCLRKCISGTQACKPQGLSYQCGGPHSLPQLPQALFRFTSPRIVNLISGWQWVVLKPHNCMYIQQGFIQT